MRYVWQSGTWCKVLQAAPAPRLAIISDTQQPLRNMADGRIYDSKSQFRAATKAAGCVELGNDAPTVTNRTNIAKNSIRDDIARAYSELEQGRSAPIAGTTGGPVRRYDERDPRER